MTKTVAISNDVHLLVVEKQLELRKKRYDYKISEIVDMSIEAGIREIDKIIESKNHMLRK